MQFERERWTPLTVVVETREEAEVLHKVLALVTDSTEEGFLLPLLVKLGEGLSGDPHFKALGGITVTHTF